MSLYTLDDLMRAMRCLRDPDYGCPWDLQQNYQTIVPFTLEEAYEVADVIERGSFDELKVELGDLLFQVIFYAQLASEEDRFGFSDVIDATVRKVLNRHPHVFPDKTFETFGNAESTALSTIQMDWENQKEKERIERGQLELFDDVPLTMPALNRAQKIQKRAAKIGFDWIGIDEVYQKVQEEITELIKASGDPICELEEYGDLLFTMVSLARHLGINSEQALRLATHKFESRIGNVINLADEHSISLITAADCVKNKLWAQAKGSR